MTPNFLARYLYGNKQEKGIKNFHLNIRSLKNKVQEVKNIISEDSPHIFGLSEVELFKPYINVDTLKIPGYDILFPKSWNSDGFARVLVYVKSNFNYEHIQDLEDESFQSIWIKGSFRNNKNIYFCHAYREHLSTYSLYEQKNALSRFLNQWEKALEHNNSNDSNEVHISLDMNLDSLNGKWLRSDYRLLSLSKMVQNFCDTGNFSQLVTEPTRFMYNSVNNTTEESCLDHIYTNAEYKCSPVTIKAFGASDHDLVTYTRYSKTQPTNTKTIRGRSYKNFCPTNFLQDLQMIDWSDVLGCLDLDEAVKLFTYKFNDIFNKHAPWIIYQQRKHFSPWITEELKIMINLRNSYKKRIKELNKISNGIVTHELQATMKEFKYYRNKINNRRKYDENLYKKNKIEENINSPQRTWSIAKKFMG